MGLQVDVLGPLVVCAGEGALDVGGPKAQAVLVQLALAEGASVSASALVEGVWGTEAPASSAGTLRVYVSRLNTGVAGGRIERSGAGWRLPLDADAVDAVRFGRLLDEARAATDPADELTRLQSALALWRGPALAGLEDAPACAAAAAALEERRRTASERCAELLLAAGEPRRVVDELRPLVAADPYREAAARLLALALARAGRSAEALQVLDTLRRRLGEDLGLEPGPAVAALQQAVLLHDPDVLGDPGVRGDAAAPPAPEQPAASAPGPVAARPPLPLPLTSFVGREAEVAAVHEALASARLVTLTGPGGSGKTRLALEAVRRLDLRGVDGPWLVDLAPLSDGALVTQAVASVLRVSTAGQVTGVEQLVAAVAGRRLLLVLDNAEHVVEHVAVLAEQLLTAVGGLQVLVTSREALHVPGERVLPVPPLSVGEGERTGDAEALFVDRAASLLPSFTLDRASAPLVRRLCTALDGIPLALELAAARLPVLGLEDVVEMLDDRFAVLAGGSRTALPRHRTLRAAVEWSFDLLAPQERRLFGAMSVFAGAVTLDAVRAVCGPEVSEPVVTLLGGLTAKSMVVVEAGCAAEAPTGTPPRRYRLLESLRAFGQEQLDEESRARLADRHAHQVADAAARLDPLLRTDQGMTAAARLDAERAEVRAALRHALAVEDRTLALRLVGHVAYHWFHRGVVEEGRGWGYAALALPGSADDEVEARAGQGIAMLDYLAGENAHGRKITARIVANAERSGNDSLLAVTLCYSGYFEAVFGDLAAAVDAFSRAGALVESGRVEEWAAAEVLMTQGQLLRAQGQPAAALAVLAQASERGAACGHWWAAGSARWIAAKVMLDVGDGPGALAALATTLERLLVEGDHTSVLACLHVAAAAAAAVEHHADGAAVLAAVDTLGARLGYSPLRMDPVDGEALRRRVYEGLDAAERAAAEDRGRAWSQAEAAAVVQRLAHRYRRASVPRQAARRPAAV